MSYILDALRKSERQRNLGRIPTLEVAYQAEPPRRRTLPWLAGVALVGALAALGWLYRPAVAPLMQARTETPEPSPAAPAAPPAAMQQAGDGRAEQARAVPEPAASTLTPRPGVTPVTPGPPPAAAGLPLPRAAEPPASTTPARTAATSGEAPRRSARQPRPPTPPRPAAERPQPAPVASRMLPTEPASAGPASPEPALPEPVLASVSPPPEAAATEPDAPAAAAPPVPLLQQMPFEFQRTVPRVRIDALVYSENPGGRMVFIGKQKYREGQQVEGKLKVERITREGVVFAYQDQQFLLRP